ncbi:EAL domain-containing protein [Rugamonas apoptosis]|uniref:EAL domain-containing protein n=1 Tax=Rugamonas apoptosis TaxID=2758570 RepID=A0A7W2IJW3_9BURK|nr:EAL domain-containing protein [Rugamonas apoptosis]MBA5686762.1 EAL domain-containing protein [Rugamonas apoptosis]
MDLHDQPATPPPEHLSPDDAGARLQWAIEQVPVGFVYLDPHCRIVHVNAHLCQMLGMTPDELQGHHYSQFLAEADRQHIAAGQAELLAAPGVPQQSDARWRGKDETLLWSHVTRYSIIGAGGAPAGQVWWVGDITQRRQLKDMLQLSNRALAACSNGVLIASAGEPDYPIMYANPAFYAMTGYTPMDIMGRNCRLLQNGDHDQPGLAPLRHALGQRQDAHVVLRNYRKDGTLFWNDLLISPVPDEHGVITHYVGILNDITLLKEKEERLTYQSTHDELTGLPNRSLFNQRLQQAMLRAGHHEHAVALLCVGLDNFELVNESLGHAAGDQMLAIAAQRLQQCMGEHDTLARLGDHEFLAILGAVNGAGDVMPVCEHMFAVLAQPFTLDGQPVHASASIGIALYPQDAADSATLMRYADLALTRAHDQGGAKFQFFAQEMNQRTLARIGMEAALRQAIARGELRLLYQPLVDLQSGAIVSVEALVRWQHPTQGLLEAAEFITVAEQAGLADTIGDWVLRQACRDLAAWHGQQLAPLPVAINISPRQFRDRLFAGTVAAVLNEHGVLAPALTLEITEACLMQDSGVGSASLARLKALGVRLTLDDFGTGYTSLSNLKRHPFDAVKIDRQFIRNIVTDSDDAALARTIISMSHHLGIQVVAEGVETEAQCDFLRRNMCDLIQGHFFAPPVTAEALQAMRDEGRALPPHLLRIQKQKRSLLLVDDEQNIVSALKRLLRKDDYQIHTANSGQEGLDVLAQHAVDVIVSDQRMPGMLGADFLRKAKLLYPDTIRIMLSGYTELQSVTDAVNEGAIYKFLTKPWEDELLRGHIAQAFQLKEIADDNARLHLEVRTANHELAAANRRMEELLLLKQRQISRDEISLNVAHDVLQHLPLPVIGMDDAGMIAFVNGAAAALFQHSGALLGNQASLVLPELSPDAGTAGAPAHQTVINGQRYDVLVYPMGERSESRGSLITLRHSEGP